MLWLQKDFNIKLDGKVKTPTYPKWHEYNQLFFPFAGVWGSAFSILFKRLIQDHTTLSLELSGCFLDEFDDDEEIFYDAVEEFQDEEDTIRDAFGKHITVITLF